MKSLFDLFWQICLFRRGPADVPYAPVLPVLLAVALLVLSALLILMLDPGFLMAKLAGTGVALTLWFALVMLILTFKKQQSRFVQTMTACLGSDLIISLMSIPVQLLSLKVSAQSAFGSLVWLAMLILIIWDILIKARIYSAAMNLSRLQGNFLAISLWFCLFLVSVAWLPQQAMQQPDDRQKETLQQEELDRSLSSPSS